MNPAAARPTPHSTAMPATIAARFAGPLRNCVHTGVPREARATTPAMARTSATAAKAGGEEPRASSPPAIAGGGIGSRESGEEVVMVERDRLRCSMQQSRTSVPIRRESRSPAREHGIGIEGFAGA